MRAIRKNVIDIGAIIVDYHYILSLLGFYAKDITEAALLQELSLSSSTIFTYHPAGP